MLSKPTSYAKALVGALVSVLGTLLVLLDDGHMSAGDGVKLAIAAAIAFGAVYATPNAEPSSP